MHYHRYYSAVFALLYYKKIKRCLWRDNCIIFSIVLSSAVNNFICTFTLQPAWTTLSVTERKYCTQLLDGGCGILKTWTLLYEILYLYLLTKFYTIHNNNQTRHRKSKIYHWLWNRTRNGVNQILKSEVDK